MKLEWDSLERDPRKDTWEHWTGAVLLDDEIKHYASHPEYPLIHPFNEKNLKPARYQLTLGSEAKVGGTLERIDKDHPLIIQPHQVAIVRTQETLNLPRFLIARWNLTVDMVYRGLLWVGALQVDPGWVGYLPCPLYNLSDDAVEIHFGEKLFTIDFVRTTRFDPKHNRSYPDKDPEPVINPRLNDYDRNHLRSGPYEALSDLGWLREFRNFALALFAVMFTAIGAVVAGLAVIVVQPVAPNNGDELLGGWALTALGIAAFALIFAVFAIALQLASMWGNFRRRLGRR